MIVYFCCSLTGGRRDQPVYEAIVDSLLARGHAVLTAHLARVDVMDEEAVAEPSAVFERDMRWLRDAQAVIAEVSTPSHGVGYEIAYALGLGRPVFCCYRAGAAVSKLIVGNTSPGIRVRAYQDIPDAVRAAQDFLDACAG
jgi:2'-deoxynucleoside 5'-phosphate N-hydrolase